MCLQKYSLGVKCCSVGLHLNEKSESNLSHILLQSEHYYKHFFIPSIRYTVENV